MKMLQIHFLFMVVNHNYTQRSLGHGMYTNVVMLRTSNILMVSTNGTRDSLIAAHN